MEINREEPGMGMDDHGGDYGSFLSSFIDKGSVESHRYYLSRITALEMLRDRGYLVDNSEIEQSLEEFRKKYSQDPDFSRLGISAHHKDDHAKKIQVLYCAPITVSKRAIREIEMQVLKREALNRLILIVQNQITTQARKALEVFPITVEIFQITELLVNVTKHVLNPQYEVLTDEEKQTLLKKYTMEEKQLPRMLKNDAIARYYGFEEGQVLKITYNNNNLAEKHVTYRCVC